MYCMIQKNTTTFGFVNALKDLYGKSKVTKSNRQYNQESANKIKFIENNTVCILSQMNKDLKVSLFI